MPLKSKINNSFYAKGSTKNDIKTWDNHLYLRFGLITSFVVLLSIFIPKNHKEDMWVYEINQPWRNEDVVAPYSFSIRKSEQDIQKQVDDIKTNTPPVYFIQSNLRLILLNKLDSVGRSIYNIYQSYSSLGQHTNDFSNADSLFVQNEMQLLANSWKITSENLKLSLEALHKNHFLNDSITSYSQFSQLFIDSIKTVTTELMDNYIIDQLVEEIPHNYVVFRDLLSLTEIYIDHGSLIDIEKSRHKAQIYFIQIFPAELQIAANAIFGHVIRPNVLYNDAITQEIITQNIEAISLYKGGISKDQIIIRKGDLVTPEKALIIQSLLGSGVQPNSLLQSLFRFLGGGVILLSLVSFCLIYLYFFHRSIFNNNTQLLFFLLTQYVIILLAAWVYYWGLSPYIIPIALGPLLVMIFFDAKLSIISVVFLSLLLSTLFEFPYEYTIASIAAVASALFSVRDIKNRSQLFFITPGIIFLIYSFISLGQYLAGNLGGINFTEHVIYIALGAMLSSFTYPFILLCERAFKMTTDLTLLDLNNTNVPILQRLIREAPGTFHHSLQVANLSEAAALAISANPLLCRVGALYHDIGKTGKSSYFSENQAPHYNRHIGLNPKMSASIVKSHIADGIDLAIKYNIPQTIINFIRTHHGTSFVRYFYEQAKQQMDDKNITISEKDFRYEGPLPNTIETGIVMLADAVEAASRTLKSFNYNKLLQLINTLIDERYDEGQLSQSPLTLRDITLIKQAFLNLLVGVYHSRQVYPKSSDKK